MSLHLVTLTPQEALGIPIALVLLYFILDYRNSRRREVSGDSGRYEASSRVTTERKSSGGGIGWLAPLAAGAGAWALLRGRNNDKQRSQSRARASWQSARCARSPEPRAARPELGIRPRAWRRIRSV